MNTLSSNGEGLIKSFESCKLQAYQDEHGVWTVGWGHTAGVGEGMTCTQAQADAWFEEDIRSTVSLVDDSLTTNVNQNQFDALVSFTFNEGIGRERSSTLLKLVNARDFAGAAAEFPKWDKVTIDGVLTSSPGLLRRRMAEQATFEGLAWQNYS
jgi:lysozyme